LNRKRLKGSGGPQDCKIALSVLFEVVFAITKAMSPFTPFLTEYFYQNLRKVVPEKEREDCVHYLMFPEVVEGSLNERILEAFGRMQTVIELGRTSRERRKLPLKFPLTQLTVIHEDPQYLQDIENLKPYILEELNLREVKCTSDKSSIGTKLKPDFQLLGKKLRGDLKKVSAAIPMLTADQIQQFLQAGQITLEGHVITSVELQVTREFSGDASKYEAAWDSNLLVVLDLQVDEQMRQQGTAREVINRIQRLRKKAGVHPTDPIEVVLRGGGSFFETEYRISEAIHNPKHWCRFSANPR